ncbi:MAG: tRNA guanosine(34) transglycosylase Tgt [Chlamydiia bacterium]|nr:tRNA guanosine(34) transglycosylase Tgt [Chlamydiia bacterium]
MNDAPFFTLLHEDVLSAARLGRIETVHGGIDTPMFMPVGTRGAVKTLTTEQLYGLDAQIILNNTYHLMLKPGIEIIEKAGGMHAMMRWDRPILTDSGGFQVFSLSHMRKIDADGVVFRSHIDGSRWRMGPKESMQIQRVIGSDIVMAFDVCPPYPAEKNVVEDAVKKTLEWAQLCREFFLQSHQYLFGIVQGGVFSDLRRQCADALVTMDFPGYAIGGLSVGEPASHMYRVLEETVPHLPRHKPRYLMGVGTPRNLIEGVMRGVDLFDCVMPTRNARNGTAFTWQGKISLKAAKYAQDFSPLDSRTPGSASLYSKAYIRHLLNVDEVTGATLLTLHNLAFYLHFMQELRKKIREGKLMEFYEEVCALYPESTKEEMPL